MPLPYRYEDFLEPGELPWLDRPDAEAAIAERHASRELTADQADKLRQWHAQGWVVLDFTVEAELVDSVNGAVEDLIARNDPKQHEAWKAELQNMYASSVAVRRAIQHPRILEWCELILGSPCRPFQTLNMPIGSQIPTHSDQILMSTHPAGYMVAAWVALEDVRDDAGPLMLWTGSHRLPYLSASAVGIPRDAPPDECSQVYARNYFDASARRMAEHGFEPYRFLAKRGQVLLWHSNIVHGGDRITRPDATRKSLIVHYYAEGVHHYSDLFHRANELPDLR